LQSYEVAEQELILELKDFDEVGFYLAGLLKALLALLQSALSRCTKPAKVLCCKKPCSTIALVAQHHASSLLSLRNIMLDHCSCCTTPCPITALAPF